VIVQVGRLKEGEDGFKYAVYVLEGKNLVAGWKSKKVIIDNEELNDDALLTYLNAKKVQLLDDGTITINTDGGE